MRKTIVLIVIILTGSFIACKKTGIESPFRKQIIGNWLVVGLNNFHSDSGIVVEWGIYYVASIGIRENGSFTIDRNPTPSGTWKLKGNESNIIFYTQVTDIGMLLKDTTEFKISIDTNEELIFEKGSTIIRHKKINN